MEKEKEIEDGKSESEEVEGIKIDIEERRGTHRGRISKRRRLKAQDTNQWRNKEENFVQQCTNNGCP